MRNGGGWGGKGKVDRKEEETERLFVQLARDERKRSLMVYFE